MVVVIFFRILLHIVAKIRTGWLSQSNARIISSCFMLTFVSVWCLSYCWYYIQRYGTTILEFHKGAKRLQYTYDFMNKIGERYTAFFQTHRLSYWSPVNLFFKRGYTSYAIILKSKVACAKINVKCDFVTLCIFKYDTCQCHLFYAIM